VRFYNLPAELAVEVFSVDPKGPAWAAGVRAGDLILAINGQQVTSVDQIHLFLSEWPIGPFVKLTIIRGKDKMEVEVSPAEARSSS
jgi:S1-C subfamily serine protease